MHVVDRVHLRLARADLALEDDVHRQVGHEVDLDVYRRADGVRRELEPLLGQLEYAPLVDLAVGLLLLDLCMIGGGDVVEADLA